MATFIGRGVIEDAVGDHGLGHIVALIKLDVRSIVAVACRFVSALEPPDYHQRFAEIVGH